MTEQEIIKKFPNKGKVSNGEVSELNTDNFFAETDLHILRQKYMRCTMLLELVHETLALSKLATLEEFGMRIRDLIIAAEARKEEQEE